MCNLSTPKISVVMAVHNGASYLPATLDSVLEQAGVSFEYIIVDDGSSDESGTILEEYSRRDSRIRILSRKHRGLTESLIEGCKNARGLYIARQDVGDLSLPDRLQFQSLALDRASNLMFVSCWAEMHGPQHEFLYVSRGTGEAVLPRDIIFESEEGPDLLDWPPHHGSVMFRKSAYEQVGGYRSEFHLAQDHDLWSRLAEVGQYQTLPQVLYVVRVLPFSRSSVYREIQLELGRLGRLGLKARRLEGSDREILERAAKLRPDENETNKGGQAQTLHFIGEMLRQNGDPRSANYFRRALQVNPWNPRTWLRMIQALFLRNRTVSEDKLSRACSFDHGNKG